MLEIAIVNCEVRPEVPSILEWGNETGHGKHSICNACRVIWRVDQKWLTTECNLPQSPEAFSKRPETGEWPLRLRGAARHLHGIAWRDAQRRSNLQQLIRLSHRASRNSPAASYHTLSSPWKSWNQTRACQTRSTCGSAVACRSIKSVLAAVRRCRYCEVQHVTGQRQLQVHPGRRWLGPACHGVQHALQDGGTIAVEERPNHLHHP
mmetsp:Transcript_93294/g.179349  ORF Transcript_93294/g.179349 Transcript_93294/m.179349 type:complete len:207 (+) Transcript_93294:736-1356(+)